MKHLALHIVSVVLYVALAAGFNASKKRMAACRNQVCWSLFKKAKNKDSEAHQGVILERHALPKDSLNVRRLL